MHQNDVHENSTCASISIKKKSVPTNFLDKLVSCKYHLSLSQHAYLEKRRIEIERELGISIPINDLETYINEHFHLISKSKQKIIDELQSIKRKLEAVS